MSLGGVYLRAKKKKTKIIKYRYGRKKNKNSSLNKAMWHFVNKLKLCVKKKKKHTLGVTQWDVWRKMAVLYATPKRYNIIWIKFFSYN